MGRGKVLCVLKIVSISINVVEGLEIYFLGAASPILQLMGRSRWNLERFRYREKVVVGILEILVERAVECANA